MSITEWSGRLTTVGATGTELASITAGYYSSQPSVQQALDALVGSISDGELLVMLNNWRAHAGPFQASYPGGGLLFSTLSGEQGVPGVSAHFRNPPQWSAIITYMAGPPPDGVLGSDGGFYYSTVDNNLNHDPVGDGGAHWVSGLPSAVVFGASLTAPLSNAMLGPLVNVPPWAAATTYPANFVVLQGGSFYSRNTTGTSAASWGADAANWTLIAGSGGLAPGQLGTDVWWSQANPGTVTDWGTIINALMVAGDTKLYYGEHPFPFTTTISMGNCVNFTGAGGLGTWQAVEPKAQLIYTPSGSASAIEVNNGCSMTDIEVKYTSGSYTGRLLDCQPLIAQNAVFTRCMFGSWSFTSARCIANLDTACEVTFDECIMGGANSGLRGYDLLGSSNSSSMTVRGGTMFGCPNGFFVNVGWNWLMDNVRFEMFSIGGSVRSKIINNDQTAGGSGSGAHFTLRDCILEDAGGTTPNGPYFHQQSWETWQAEIRGLDCVFNMDGPLMQFDGTGDIRIEDNPNLSVTSGAVMDLGTVIKGRIRVTGNAWQTAQASGNPDILNIATQIAGGCDLLIENNGPSDPSSGLANDINRPVTRSVIQAQDLHNNYGATGAGTIALPDPALGRAMSMYQLTGNCTFQLPGPASSGGKRMRLVLVQDGTGGRTPSFTCPTGGATALNTYVLAAAAGSLTMIELYTAFGTWYYFTLGHT